MAATSYQFITGTDWLRGAGEPRAPLFDTHAEVATREVDEHVTCAVRGCCDGDGARSRGGRLPYATLPDPGGDLSRPVDMRDLNVRAFRETRVGLEERSELSDPSRIAEHDRVRVADRNRDQRDAGDDLGRRDLDLAEADS